MSHIQSWSLLNRKGKNSMLLMGLPSGGEWFVILLVALLLFGKRLPEVARSMGQSVTEFKKGLNGIHSELKETRDSAFSENLSQNTKPENKDEKKVS